uniref:PPM-type phosphatase domain-containing protein n=1 Tax=Mycobacterium sp. (strain JLS) TaxID=164757 RepID=A0A5Q5CBS7_MYCSJ
MRPGCPDGAPRWAVCGASVTGQEHERRGLGCDDAYSYGVAGNYVVAAVADGAGAVTGTSAWGAYAACQSVLTDGLQPAFVENFRSGDPEQLMRWLFDNALTRVTRQAAALGVEPMRLSTTLCVAVADHGRAVFGQIGDGVIAAELYDGRVGSLLIEEKDGYANTTSFLQSDRAFEESFRTQSVDGVTAFALSTDGMSYKITDIGTGEAYEPFFRDSWQHVRAGARADQFAALLRGITDDQTGDDKTMVLAAVSGSAVGAVTDSSPAPGTSVAELETVPLTRGARRRGLWRRRR